MMNIDVNQIELDRTVERLKGNSLKKDEQLKKTCADFESVLLNVMLQSMRKTITNDSLFGSSLQKDMFTSMYDQEIANEIAKGKGTGIKDVLYNQLKKYVSDP
ncbi:MAG: rod-binding protein [Desulfobacterales bacterium]|nr:rod-binding protein [Desulfobacterales bacterium]